MINLSLFILFLKEILSREKIDLSGGNVVDGVNGAGSDTSGMRLV